jgi:hypothetical protein
VCVCVCACAIRIYNSVCLLCAGVVYGIIACCSLSKLSKHLEAEYTVSNTVFLGSSIADRVRQNLHTGVYYASYVYESMYLARQVTGRDGRATHSEDENDGKPEADLHNGNVRRARWCCNIESTNRERASKRAKEQQIHRDRVGEGKRKKRPKSENIYADSRHAHQPRTLCTPLVSSLALRCVEHAHPDCCVGNRRKVLAWCIGTPQLPSAIPKPPPLSSDATAALSLLRQTSQLQKGTGDYCRCGCCARGRCGCSRCTYSLHIRPRQGSAPLTALPTRARL